MIPKITPKGTLLLVIAVASCIYFYVNDWALRKPTFSTLATAECLSGEHLKVTGVISNHSPFPLTIENVMPSCGCVNVVFEETVGPFASQEIDFQIDTLGRAGYVDFGGVFKSSVMGKEFGARFSIPVMIKNAVWVNKDFFSYEVDGAQEYTASGQFWIFDEGEEDVLNIASIESSLNGLTYDIVDLRKSSNTELHQACEAFLQRDYPNAGFRPRYLVEFSWHVPIVNRELRNELRVKPVGTDATGAKVFLSVKPTVSNNTVTPCEATVYKGLSTKFSVTAETVEGVISSPSFDKSKIQLVDREALSQGRVRFVFQAVGTSSFSKEKIEFSFGEDKSVCFVSFVCNRK